MSEEDIRAIYNEFPTYIVNKEKKRAEENVGRLLDPPLLIDQGNASQQEELTLGEGKLRINIYFSFYNFFYMVIFLEALVDTTKNDSSNIMQSMEN